MDTDKKLKILGEQARFDSGGCPSMYEKKFNAPFIRHTTGKNGCPVKLFEVLQTNACKHNCRYCVNRSGRNFTRMSFTPEELASTFMEYCKGKIADGLFLSSGVVKNSNYTQEEILKTLILVREKYNFKGYIHTKIMPGADTAIINEVSKYTDRMSVNLEGVSQKYLSELAPNKNFNHLTENLKKISDIDKNKSLKAGLVTQLVVGGASETDSEIVNLADNLYKNLNLWRVYYSKFEPVPETPLEGHKPCTQWREVRLYQADWLLRKYGFRPQELPFDKKGGLPQDTDPKTAWAKLHPEFFPIEINTAPFEKILRVPGIGRRGAYRITTIRRHTKLLDPDILKKMGIRTARSNNYMLLNGKYFGRETTRWGESFSEKAEEGSYQPFLWEEF